MENLKGFVNEKINQIKQRLQDSLEYQTQSGYFPSGGGFHGQIKPYVITGVYIENKNIVLSRLNAKIYIPDFTPVIDIIGGDYNGGEIPMAYSCFDNDGIEEDDYENFISDAWSWDKSRDAWVDAIAFLDKKQKKFNKQFIGKYIIRKRKIS